MGHKVNYDKTCIYRIGSLKNTNAKLYTTKNIKWSDGNIEMLGITLSNCEQQNCNSFNSFNSGIDKMETVLVAWFHHNLTLMGKIVIINLLVASILVYKMMILPPLSKLQQDRMV